MRVSAHIETTFIVPKSIMIEVALVICAFAGLRRFSDRKRRRDHLSDMHLMILDCLLDDNASRATRRIDSLLAVLPIDDVPQVDAILE